MLIDKLFCKKFNSNYAITFNSGTSTLHAALESYKFPKGSEVISPALTVIMDTTATILAGLTPVYADIDPQTFNIAPHSIEEKITDKTRAIIAVSLYGLPCDLKAINEIAKKYDLVVIEDNAQSLKENESDIASYSFESTKLISCGEGGLLTTNDESKAIQLRKIGNHGFKNCTASEGRTKLNLDIFQDPNYKRHDTLGFNYRLSEFQAAIALAQLEEIEEILYWRKSSANCLINSIVKYLYWGTLMPQFYSPENTFFTMAVKYEGEKTLGVSWQEFRKEFISNGGDGFYGAWSVPWKEPVFTDYFGTLFKNPDCPIAEDTQKKIMQFPTNYTTAEEIERNCIALEKTMRKF